MRWVCILTWFIAARGEPNPPIITDALSRHIGNCPSDIAQTCSGSANCKRNNTNSRVDLECWGTKGSIVGEFRCDLTESEACTFPGLHCAHSNISQSQCDLGCHSTFYRCKAQDLKQCASRESLCNGKLDGCGRQTDENSYGTGFRCFKHAKICVIPNHLVGDGIEDCDEGDDERPESFYFNCRDKAMKIPKSRLCDGQFDCFDMSDECFCFKGNVPATCFVDMGLLNCTETPQDVRCLQKTPCDETYQEQTTYKCKPFRNRTNVISDCRVCDLHIDCPLADDEINCTDDERRFYCASGTPIFVLSGQVNDGRIDCRNGSDECIDVPGSNTLMFNNRQDMLGNTFLVVLVWVILAFALGGNLIVLVQQVRVLWSMRYQHDALASLRANHLLVLNLTLANLVMVAYLACLGVSYEILRGSYCQEEQKWRSGQTCTAMGILVVVSTETSVQTLVALSVVRLYAVRKPYNTSKKPKLKYLIPFILFTWVLSVIIAWVPLSSPYRHSVPDEVWLPDNPFLENVEANLTAAKDYLYRFVAFAAMDEGNVSRTDMNAQIAGANTWDQAVAVHRQLAGDPADFDIKGRFTYYNLHSVCIPDIFPSNSSTHLVFSLVVTNLNLFSFVFVALVYGAIYAKTMLSTTAYIHGADAVAMQWKVFRITAINFCCWIPIYIVSYLRLAGVVIAGDVYAVAAIVLLPINSAVSPLLYSNAVPVFVRYVKSYCARFKESPMRRKSVELSEL